jgi:hypothetical protein
MQIRQDSEPKILNMAKDNPLTPYIAANRSECSRSTWSKSTINGGKQHVHIRHRNFHGFYYAVLTRNQSTKNMNGPGTMCPPASTCKTSTVVLDRLNVIIDRLTFIIDRLNVFSSGSVHPCLSEVYPTTT